MNDLLFKIKVWCCNLLRFVDAPLCRVYNENRTESYTLLKNGYVNIESTDPKSKSMDSLPIMFCSEELVLKFEKELEK